ncbi:P24 oleosin-like [Neltuma alba]|uniref:P24 oleosin-like n=1 Tax=Neltuma alba TaxID=207710 RepID=UPI0010A50993|nr:P24 oleosin-like [Prosopis alba]
MSDRSTQIHVHPTTRYEAVTTRYEGGLNPQYRYEGGAKSTLFPESGPSTAQMIAILAGVPIGGTLLMLAGFTLMGTLLGLAVTVPLFILFSPVLVPATMVIGLAVAGFLTSGACALIALSSFSWVMNYIRQTQGTIPEQLDSAKRRMADVVGQVGQKTKEVGQDIQSKAHEVKRS